MRYLRLIALSSLDISLYLFANLLVLTLRISSSKAALKISSFLIYITLKLLPRSEYVMKRNLSLMFPDMAKEEKLEIIKKHKQSLARNVLGFALGPLYTKSQAEDALDISDCREIVQELENQSGDTGTLLLIPHFGSFELLNHLWCLKTKPYSILARPFGLPILDLYWNSQREASGNEVFGRKGGFNEVVKKLKEGKNVAILFDQNVKRSHGMFAPFFNHPASTTKTIALASVRTGCKILFGTCVENGENKYKLYAQWIKSPKERKGSTDDRVRATLTDANLALENLVRQYPDQWFLTHRRFKTRPKGEPENWYDPDLYPER